MTRGTDKTVFAFNPTRRVSVDPRLARRKGRQNRPLPSPATVVLPPPDGAGNSGDNGGTPRRRLLVADLFAGAGGALQAFKEAAEARGYEIDAVAVNHCQAAIKTHEANFPGHLHYISDVAVVNPLEAVPGGYLDALVAGIKCTHHSRAAGGRPRNRQARADAFDIIHWLEVLYVRNVLIENVAEFLDWGPLDENDLPDPRYKGYYFRLFVDALRELGYSVQWRVLRAADYGDPTSRERLFLQATRGGDPLWPAATHRPAGVVKDFPGCQPWRSALECIDLSLPSISIYERKEHGLEDLVPNTLERIYKGVYRYSTLPFLLGQHSGATARLTGEPLSTITTDGRVLLCDPLLVVMRNNSGALPLSGTMPTICCSRGHLYLMQPFLLPQEGIYRGNRERALTECLPTITTRGAGGVCEPFLVGNGGPSGSAKPRTASLPLGTIMGQDKRAIVEPLIEPLLIRYNGGKGKTAGPFRGQTLTEPLTTVDTQNRFALCQFTVSYYGNGTALSVSDPLATVTTRDRFALVRLEMVPASPSELRERFGGKMDDLGEDVALFGVTIVGWLDILYRMLTWRELANAHSFPQTYQFLGSDTAIKKQIGNSWPVKLGAAVIGAMLDRPGGLLPNNFAVATTTAANSRLSTEMRFAIGQARALTGVFSPPDLLSFADEKNDEQSAAGQTLVSTVNSTISSTISSMNSNFGKVA